jgi:molecular chaperone HtpG
MKENQKLIYFITGESVETVENSPFLERLKKRDLEVLYMTDPLDEYVVQVLTEFDDHTLASVTKDGLELPGEKKDKNKKVEEEFTAFNTWLKDIYGDKVEKVKISNRLGSSPCVLVTGQYGWSANMERIMKAQTFSDASKNTYMYSKKTMEINPRHPLIQEMKKKSTEDAKDKALEDMANLMYDGALLTSGFSHKSPSEFATRIHRVMSIGLGIDPNAPVPEEEEKEEAEEAEGEEASGDAPAEDSGSEPAAETAASEPAAESESDGLKDEL